MKRLIISFKISYSRLMGNSSVDVILGRVGRAGRSGKDLEDGKVRENITKC